MKQNIKKITISELQELKGGIIEELEHRDSDSKNVNGVGNCICQYNNNFITINDNQYGGCKCTCV